MIIGLSGYAQSGKDTVAGLLIGLHKYDNRAFADTMRNALYTLNPLVYVDQYGGETLKEVVDLMGWEWAKKNTDTRRLLQVFGTEIGRKMFGESFWVEQAVKDIAPENKIVFTDVRFPNEAQVIKDLGGQIWRIIRPGYAPVNDHPSESAMDYWSPDKVIMNNTGLEGLKAQVNSNMKEINGL